MKIQKRKNPEVQHVHKSYSNFSSSYKRDKTTSLFVSSISPAKKISSRIAYTYKSWTETLSNLFKISPCKNWRQDPTRIRCWRKSLFFSIKTKNGINESLFRYDSRDESGRTKDFNKKMNCLKISQLIIICIYTDAKEQSSISPIYDFIIAKLIFQVQGNQEKNQKKTKYEHGEWTLEWKKKIQSFS